MKASQVKDELIWDWSRPELIKIEADATLASAVSLMKRHGIHHLIVFDRNQLAGVLDARDCAGVWNADSKVRSVARMDVPTVDEKTEIGQVVELLVHRRFTAVPLLRNGIVRGVLTTTDLIRLLESQMNDSHRLSNIVEKGKDWLAQPILQSLARLLGGAGI